MSSLRPAHRGYHYQDLLAAYCFAAGLLGGLDEAVADTKETADDRFDDLCTVVGETRTRLQIKYSTRPGERLRLRHLTDSGSDLCFERLYRTYLESERRDCAEYRLAATWDLPIDDLRSLLVPAAATPTVRGSRCQLFHLDADLVWAKGGTGGPLRLPHQLRALGREPLSAFLRRFVVELNLPAFTGDLTAPGDLEIALTRLLVEGVGAGQYPNRDRSAEDLASTLIGLARLAREDALTVTPSEIERHLRLRTDYGRVSQAFPVVKGRVQERPALRQQILGATDRGKHVLLLGPPGMGKSWELTELSDALACHGQLVARHYCFLEPGDPLVERRITVDALFGNLVASLVDADPGLRDVGATRYSSGQRELEELVRIIVEQGRGAWLVIDGLDHIARVLQAADSVAVDETQIVQRLASLDLPDEVRLVLGSQPGDHLDLIRRSFGDQLVELNVPPWELDEMRVLADQIGLPTILDRAGITDPAPIVDDVVGAAEGNPLIGTYLCREVASGVESGALQDPRGWVQTTPAISGRVEAYYAYLYGSASQTGQAIADILGAIDFGIDRDELREMLPPPNRGWLDRALSHLRPILTEVGTQGGIRIFHESFRRYMVDRLREEGRSIRDVLSPVVEWLERRGFFADGRSYRFLLPALRRSGRSDRISELVQSEFLIRSLSHGHSLDAVERNLALAAAVAAEEQRWPALVCVSELSRAAYTCFEQNLPPIAYWLTYAGLFEAEGIAERLLVDGRPTQEPGRGLVLCSMAQDLGTAPPWTEYLALFAAGTNTSTRDEQYEEHWDERVSLARLHGQLVAGDADSVEHSIFSFLVKGGDRASERYLRGLSRRLARERGPESALSMVDRVAASDDAPGPDALCALFLGVADACRGEPALRETILRRASSAASGLAQAWECLDTGARLDWFDDLEAAPDDFRIGCGEHLSEEVATAVEHWYLAMRIAARRGQDVSPQLDRIEGEGWYPCWLRFTVRQVIAEAVSLAGRKPDLEATFEELTRDTRPFSGKPRACDLFSVSGLIHSTIDAGLSLVRSRQDAEHAFHCIGAVMDGTSVSLSNSPMGPLYVGRILESLVELAPSHPAPDLLVQFAEQTAQRSRAAGTYLSTFAEEGLALARLHLALGLSEEATREWDSVARWLTGYGFRKDITLFEIIDSLSAFGSSGTEAALEAFSAAQELADAVPHYTDGRSTNRAPGAWYKALASFDTARALRVLFSSAIEPDALPWHVLDDAARDAAAVALQSAPPIIVSELLGSVGFDSSYADETARLLDQQLAALASLGEECGWQELAARISRLAAQALDDVPRHQEQTISRLREFGRDHSVAFLADLAPRSITSSTSTPKPPRGTYDRPHIEGELFDVEVSLPGVLRDIRRMSAAAPNAGDLSAAWAANTIGYRVLALAEMGASLDDLVGVLRSLARGHPWRLDVGRVLGDLAQGFHRAHEAKLATSAYVLAYCWSRGGWGFADLGGKDAAEFLEMAIALDRDTALQTLAFEVGYKLRHVDYNRRISRGLIERLPAIGLADEAVKCWWSAYEVIRTRFPEDLVVGGPFVPLGEEPKEDWSIAEGLVGVALAYLENPLLDPKIAALFTLRQAIREAPELVVRPVREMLSRNSSTTTVTLLLCALREFESREMPVTRALEEILLGYARAAPWSIRQLATDLLRRHGAKLPPVTAPEIHFEGSDRVSNPGVWLSADVGNRLEVLEEAWPQLPEVVASQLARTFNSSERHPKRCRARHEHAFGREGKIRPPVPTLLWETELLECSLQTSLNGLSAHLWRTGERATRSDSDYLESVLPAVSEHLSWSASRAPRPDLPFPDETDSRVLSVTQVSDADVCYAGWYRAGYVELAWIRESYRNDTPTRGTIAFAGLIAGSVSPPDGALPYQSGGAVSRWWEPVAGTPKLGALSGPLIGYVHRVDWLRQSRFLVPPTSLFLAAPLRPADRGSPLAWTDLHGNPRVVLRTWHTADGSQLDGKPRRCEGCELLVEPTVFQAWSEKVRNPISYFQVCWEANPDQPPD